MEFQEHADFSIGHVGPTIKQDDLKKNTRISHHFAVSFDNCSNGLFHLKPLLSFSCLT